jgi:hypothetical protein
MVEAPEIDKEVEGEGDQGQQGQLEQPSRLAKQSPVVPANPKDQGGQVKKGGPMVGQAKANGQG